MQRLKLLLSFLLVFGFYACEHVTEVEKELSEEATSKQNTKNSIGQFSGLTYNIAGLPAGISGGDPAKNTPKIGKLVRDYTIVHVQEDFNYHAVLYENDNHPYRSATSGGALIGSGLNRLSRYPFIDFQRIRWKKCNGADCLTPKGFTFARQRIAEGVYIDFYNVHTNAGTGGSNYSTRRSNILQLKDFISANSRGNAVVVMGDMNCRYTRSEDNIRALFEVGLTDAWIELIRNGSVPAYGSSLSQNCPVTDPSCELVDKIFYRSSVSLTLTATNYKVESVKFVDEKGNRLSDHYPVSTNFSWKLTGTFLFSDMFGGPHGSLFNDVSGLSPSSRVKRIVLRAGTRVDQVRFDLQDGTVLSHGGNGGSQRTLTLNPSEYITEVTMYSGKKSGHTRIFYIEFKTNQNRTISGGKKTGKKFTYKAKPGYQIVGFQGRSGGEIDRLGVIANKQ